MEMSLVFFGGMGVIATLIILYNAYVDSNSDFLNKSGKFLVKQAADLFRTLVRVYW
jgi:hypothetical protein